jgi:hypothetical protein
MGKDNRDEGNDIDRQDFADEYALYACDLSPDLTDNEISISPDTGPFALT